MVTVLPTNAWQLPQGARADKILYLGLSLPLSPPPPAFFLSFFLFSGIETRTRTTYIPGKFSITKPHSSLLLIFLLNLDVF